MSDNTDPTKDPKFKKVVNHFLKTPPKPHKPKKAEGKKEPRGQDKPEKQGGPAGKAGPP